MILFLCFSEKVDRDYDKNIIVPVYFNRKARYSFQSTALRIREEKDLT